MSELRLFSITGASAQECHPAAYKLEREVQSLFEANLEALLGVRFVASEFSTGEGGRIDTLGIDENGFPVVIEYKLDKHRNVINQGMSYMVWLRSHRAEFWKVVFEKLGKEVADSIDHTSTRLICIATDFTRDDLGGYEMMPNFIDLIRYRRYGEHHLLLERITSKGADSNSNPEKNVASRTTNADSEKGVAARIEEASDHVRLLYGNLRQTILEQGDDITERSKVLYIAFSRMRTFATITFPNKNELALNLIGNFDDLPKGEGVTDARHGWGSADLLVRIRTDSDIATAMPYIVRAYEGQI